MNHVDVFVRKIQSKDDYDKVKKIVAALFGNGLSVGDGVRMSGRRMYPTINQGKVIAKASFASKASF